MPRLLEEAKCALTQSQARRPARPEKSWHGGRWRRHVSSRSKKTNLEFAASHPASTEVRGTQVLQTAPSCSSCRQRADPDRRAGGWTRGRTHDHHAGRAEVRCGRRGGSGIGGLHRSTPACFARRVTQLQRRIIGSLHDRGRMRMRRERENRVGTDDLLTDQSARASRGGGLSCAKVNVMAILAAYHRNKPTCFALRSITHAY